jgi:glycosyltransferase involved in cell wall biosynthesis
MKIVYLANSKIPSRTANSIHVMKMCQAFAKNGHAVVLMTPDYGDIEPDVDDIYTFYGVDNCFAVQKIPLWPNRLKKLHRRWVNWQVRQHRPDLVYARCHGLKLYSLETLGLPLVFEAHALYRHHAQLSRLIMRSHLKRVVVISEELRQDHQAHFGTPDRLMQVVHDGADEPPSTAPAALEARSATSISTSTPLKVGYVGHLYPGKGMEIIGELAPKVQWADFHVIGGSPDDLKHWQDQLQNSHNVFLHGFMAPAQTEQYRQACDVLLAPYQSSVTVPGGGDVGRWMSPLKIFEYMAAGKAILASDLPVLREILNHGHTALLCSPNQVESWIEGLSQLQQNPDLRASLGHNARAVFQAKHTWQARAKQVIDHLELENFS